jgi:hypothetical protein
LFSCVRNQIEIWFNKMRGKQKFCSSDSPGRLHHRARSVQRNGFQGRDVRCLIRH